jgi:hypothetical protein
MQWRREGEHLQARKQPVHVSAVAEEAHAFGDTCLLRTSFEFAAQWTIPDQHQCHVSIHTLQPRQRMDHAGLLLDGVEAAHGSNQARAFRKAKFDSELASQWQRRRPETLDMDAIAHDFDATWRTQAMGLEASRAASHTAATPWVSGMDRR